MAEWPKSVLPWWAPEEVAVREAVAAADFLLTPPPGMPLVQRLVMQLGVIPLSRRQEEAVSRVFRTILEKQASYPIWRGGRK